MSIAALIVGSGGREHASLELLLTSEAVGRVIWAPGNGGTEDSLRRNVKADDISGIVQLAKDENIDFVFVGPEAPLAAGLVDALNAAKIPSFGPTAAAAALEADKKFTKDLLYCVGARTPAYEWAVNIEQAEAIIRRRGAPIVIKANGLCAGKGVKVAMTTEEACAFARKCLVEHIYDVAGSLILIEDFAPGPEFSLMCLSDGVNVRKLRAVRDAKRALDGDKGENTGGMGAYSPVADVTAAHEEEVMQTAVRPVIREMGRRGKSFKGCLYAGCALTPDGPTIYEFNARFGDPEFQVIVALHKSGLVENMLACSEYGGLANVAPPVFSEKAAVNVVLTAPGYPESPKLKGEIFGLENAGHVIHAGTRRENGRFFVNGGRVLNIVRTGKDVAEARASAYADADKIPHLLRRSDIAAHA